MSRYSGRYYRGASKDVRQGKRAQAEARNLAAIGVTPDGTVKNTELFLAHMLDVGKRRNAKRTT